MKKKCFLIIVASLFAVFFTKGQQMTFRNLTTASGLTDPNVWAVAQDKQGFIWIGAESGLMKFDGTNIKVYYASKDTNSLINDYINHLNIDNQGVLWVSTNDGLCSYDYEFDRFKRYHIIDTIKKDNLFKVTEVCFTKDNRVFAASILGLYLVQPNDQSLKKCFDGVFRSCVADKNGIIWSDNKNGLVRYDPITQEKEIYSTTKGKFKLKENSIFRLFIDSNEHLYISYYNFGIDMVDMNTWNVTYYEKTQNQQHSLISNGTYVFCELENKQIAMGSGYGLSVLNKSSQEFEHYYSTDNENSLLSNVITVMWRDFDGGLWIGCRGGGVSYYDHRSERFKHYKHEKFNGNSVVNNNVTSFTQDADNNIWIATDGGGISCFNQKNNQFTNYSYSNQDPNSIVNNKILSIQVDKNGELWLGTWEGGIDRFIIEKDKLVLKKRYFYLNQADKRTNRIFKLYSSKGGQLYAGTWDSGAYLYNELLDKFELVQGTADGQQINDIQIDKYGNQWFATSFNGLFCIDKDNQVTIYKNSDEKYQLKSDKIFNLYCDADDNLWIGTSQGLFLFDYKTRGFMQFDKSSGLPDNQIKGILESSNGDLWISSNNGISQAVKNNNGDSVMLTFKNFGLPDNIQDKSFNNWASFKSADGTLFFGGTKGFNCFNPDSFVYNTNPPSVYFTDFLIDNQSVQIVDKNSPLQKHISSAKQIKLNYDQQYITFKFVAVNYIISEKNNYAYKMEGYEDKWHNVGSIHEATYTNLDPGTYIFRVKASNNDDVWNEKGTSIKIIIMPPWWKTWWFRSIVIFIIIGSALTFFRVRINILKKQKQILEEKVDERTSQLMEANVIMEEKQEEIQQQNEEIHAQANELLNTNSTLELKNKEIEKSYKIVNTQNKKINGSIRYAKTIQNSILPAKTTIDKYFDNFILFRPKDIVSGDFYWYTTIPQLHATSLHFCAVVDCTGHGVPGAFMSLIGNRLLNEIVNEKQIYSPAKILKEMHNGICKALSQDTTNNDDGMDVCLIRIEDIMSKDEDEQRKYKITFSGAKRSLYYFDTTNQDLITIKGCVNSIGGKHHKINIQYEDIDINSGGNFYLTSDGFVDQNNKQRKSFGTTRLKKLLHQIKLDDMQTQKQKLEAALDQYQDNEEQRDDITIIGLRL